MVFHGIDADEATQNFDSWFGYGVEEYRLTRQRIRAQADGSLHMYLSHVPHAMGYEIHVTALLAVEPAGVP